MDKTLYTVLRGINFALTYFALKVKNFQYYCCTVCQVVKKLLGNSK